MIKWKDEKWRIQLGVCKIPIGEVEKFQTSMYHQRPLFSFLFLQSEICRWHRNSLKCGIRGSFFLSLLFSRSQVVKFFKVKTSFFEWKHCHISLKSWSFHPMPASFWTKKRCHLMTFTWRLESERKKELQIPRLGLLKCKERSMNNKFDYWKCMKKPN